MTMDIERLDYSKPPPGYVPHPFRTAAAARFHFAFVDEASATVLESQHANDEAAAIVATWSITLSPRSERKR